MKFGLSDRIIYLLLISFIALLMPYGSDLVYAKTPYVDDIKANKKALQALQKQHRSLTKQYSDSQKALKKHDQKLSQIQQELSNLNEQMQQNEEQLTKTRLQLELTLSHISEEQKALRQQLRIAYQQGKPHPLQVILSEQQPGTWEQIATYHKAFMTKRNERFLALKALEDEKKSQETLLIELSQTLQSQTEEANQKSADVKALRNKQQRIAERVQKERGQNLKHIDKLNDERKSLENLLALWQSRQVYSQPFAQRKGKLEWPVLGKVISGGKKLTKAHQKGIFITAQPGTEVKAVHAGQVIFADWLRGFGMMCIIDHGDGFLTLYGHNESLVLSAGDEVQAGQVIGTVGSSGGVSQSGVYFELRRNGQANDARQWLAKK